MVNALPFPEPRSGHAAPVPPAADLAAEPLCIDCDQCALQDTAACGDCIVTFLCGVDAAEPVVVDLAEARAMRVLGEAGLAPPLRHRHRAV